MIPISPKLEETYQDLVDEALATGRIDAELPAHGFQRPIQLASRLSDPRRLEKLLRAGAAVDFDPRIDVNAPVVLAVREGRIENLRLLVAAGADLSRVTPDTEARTTEFFCRFDAADEVGAWSLWLDAGGEADGRCFNGVPHVQNAIRRLRDDVMRLLLARGADIGARDPASYTALTVACACRMDPDRFVAPLLDAGADINERGPQGHTPLIAVLSESLAFGARHLATVRLLLARGADAAARDVDGRNALHHLAQTLAWRIEVGHAEPQDRVFGPQTVRALLEAGLSLHDSDPRGTTPLDLLRQAWSGHEALALLAAV